MPGGNTPGGPAGFSSRNLPLQVIRINALNRPEARKREKCRPMARALRYDARCRDGRMARRRVRRLARPRAIVEEICRRAGPGDRRRAENLRRGRGRLGDINSLRCEYAAPLSSVSAPGCGTVLRRTDPMCRCLASVMRCAPRGEGVPRGPRGVRAGERGSALSRVVARPARGVHRGGRHGTTGELG